MKNKLTVLIVVLIFSSLNLRVQKNKKFEIESPDGEITLLVESGAKLLWSVQLKGQQIIEPYKYIGFIW